eukprot:TRINITY_DN838_c0_g1_i1.p1 TRINITY_DN838_c0_g1~~TRINITY_DN838_c0_g1_i1.p1  ORF type:complete len:755 (-),score=199.74 TRINITY_DN838_c0_g1_i1:438-2702(-)
MEKPNAAFSVLALGDEASGRSCLIARFANNTVDPCEHVQADPGRKGSPSCKSFHGVVPIVVRALTSEIRLNIKPFRGGGQSVPTYQAVAILYDCTDPVSFRSVIQYFDRFARDRNMPVVLVETKVDLEAHRMVDQDESRRFAIDLGMQFFPTSARTGEGINDLFSYLATELNNRANPEDPHEEDTFIASTKYAEIPDYVPAGSGRFNPKRDGVVPKHKWQPDNEAPTCPICRADFGIFMRKHHCRACGQIFCDSCSSFRLELPQGGYNGPQRVCKNCYIRGQDTASVPRVASAYYNKAGSMFKEGGSIKTWKRRWFMLREGYLAYYKSDKDTEPIDRLFLPLASSIRKCEVKASSNGKKMVNAFEMVMPWRTYAFSCDSDAERKAWIDAMLSMKALHMNDTPPPEKPSRVRKSQVSQVSLNDFDLLTTIGKGTFGKVIQVRKKDTGKVYAMKVLDKKHILDNDEVMHTLAEKNILQRVRHPFLVNLNFSFQTDDKLYFILDFVNGGELFHHLQKDKRFTEDRARYYAAEILLALECLHKNGIVYRDLKPENILLTNEGHICLTDFGLSKEGIEKDTDKTSTFCGTPEYLAPEVLRGKGYGRSVDWWSFGSFLYEMLCGLPPFYSKDVQAMYRKIMTENVRFPSHVGPEARDILTQLLQRETEKRLTDPAKLKAHPFFAAIRWDDLVNKKVKPPFIPRVADEADVSQIDPVFRQEAPFIPSSGSSDIKPGQQQSFQGFTYTSEQQPGVRLSQDTY